MQTPSKATIARIYALLSSEETVEALKDFAACESDRLIANERVAIRSGDLRTASLMEGGAMLLEDLVGVLFGYAKKHTPTQ